MRFGFHLFMVDPAEFLEIARTADEWGWDSIQVADAPFFPETTYELQIPVWILYALALLGAAMMLVTGLYTVLRAARWVRDGAEGTP